MKRGFTLFEIIIVLAIVAVMASIIVYATSRFNTTVSLRADVGKIVSILDKAKTDTVASRGGMQYGVHFETKKVVLFYGDTYSANAPTNVSSPLSAPVSISAVSLTGGGSDVVFQRLTGITDMPGTITLRSSGAGAVTATISVSGNGVVTSQ